MDGSLQVGRHQGVQSPRHSYQHETSSHIEVPERPEHYSARSPGVRPVSIHSDSRAHLNANGASAAYKKWQHESPEISPQTFSSQDGSRLGHDIETTQVGDSQSVSDESNISRLEASNYTMPSTNPPGVSNASRLDVIGRRRSQSIGSGPRGSRIAAVGLSHSGSPDKILILFSYLSSCERVYPMRPLKLKKSGIRIQFNTSHP